MSRFIDKRLNNKNKSAINRQRFIKRYKNQIKKAIKNSVINKGISDIDQGERIIIPTKDLKEPSFSIGKGGVKEQIFPGNTEFSVGDKIQRPPQDASQDGTGEASNKGSGEDDFVFDLSREEFLDLYFDDLELPDLIKKELSKIDQFKYLRGGFASTGIPSNLNIVRSMKQATGRRIALANPHKSKLKKRKDELAKALLKHDDENPIIIDLKEQIAKLQKKIKAVPFIDTIDLRYNNKIKVPRPSTKAVMFCLMDVSGSMDEGKKEIAKRFFILLYIFLTRNYEKIDIVFIRHHTSAKRVNETDFFYSRETGGTVVSSALEMMNDIINSEYPSSQWNIYGAQASDGDNWNADSPRCQELLLNNIMPNLQYFSYVEIMPRHHQSLWQMYTKVAHEFNNFAMQNIDNIKDIYPVFRELFKRKIT